MFNPDTLTPAEFAGLIDHTYLKAFGDAKIIDRLCAEAAEYRFASVAVNGCEVARCAAALRGTGVKVTAVAGFPLGQMTTEAKLFEVRDALAKGAGEVDIVRALQSGDAAFVRNELAQFARICRDAGAVSKVILENCYLTDAQKERACALACEADVDFVKTSTGFGTGGATVADVALMRRCVGPERGVKAAGGIRTLADARALLRAGATRLGTSAGVALVEALRTQGIAPTPIPRKVQDSQLTGEGCDNVQT
ncbi:MAG: deoxyribose-phosphate aldolase [bacterium]|nr:deoxyribose-phosphate aldolase [bacterium]